MLSKSMALGPRKVLGILALDPPSVLGINVLDPLSFLGISALDPCTALGSFKVLVPLLVLGIMALDPLSDFGCLLNGITAPDPLSVQGIIVPDPLSVLCINDLLGSDCSVCGSLSLSTIFGLEIKFPAGFRLKSNSSSSTSE